MWGKYTLETKPNNTGKVKIASERASIGLSHLDNSCKPKAHTLFQPQGGPPDIIGTTCHLSSSEM